MTTENPNPCAHESFYGSSTPDPNRDRSFFGTEPDPRDIYLQHRIVWPNDEANRVQFEVMKAVLNERIRQDQKFGRVQKNVDINILMNVLTEEVGEAAKEVNDGTSHQFRQAALRERARKGETVVYGGPNYAHRLRDELVQVAAVAVKMIEYLDRTQGGTFHGVDR